MKRLFGTDGIRGVAGAFPLDDATVERIGRALALSLGAAAGRPPRVVVGRDTRESGPSIEAALVRGLEAEGARTDRGGVLTTPAIACVARLLGFDAGVVLSASHNPYRDNGIKVFSGRGQKLPDALEAAIERRVLESEAQADDHAHAHAWCPAPAGAPAPAPIGPDTLQDRYLDWLLAAGLEGPPGAPGAATGRGAGAPGAGSSGAAGTALAGVRIALDCANGAASALAPELFRRAGAEVIAIAASPDGRNINDGGGALHPETLAAEVVRRKATFGLAFDGDADRCIAVDASGRVLDGDYILCLMARAMRHAGRLRGDAIVGTVMSNLWLEQALHAEGIRLLRAPVGDKYVLEEMQRHGIALGGEQSGHIIFLDRATTGDGLLTGLLLADLLRRERIDLAAWAATIRPCPQILVNVPVRSRPPLESHPRIGPAIRDEEARLGGQGRLLVRYSGTEPKARIMVEGTSKAVVEECAARLKQVIQQEIG